MTIIGWQSELLPGQFRRHTYPDGVWHQYEFELLLKRSGLTSAVRIFVPLLCFLMISFITLMLTPESYDKRLGTNTGMLIASVMFHVAVIASLPPLGYLTLADRTVMATYVTIGFHVLLCVRIQRLWMNDAKERAHRVHKTSRWAVPPVAVISCVWAVASTFS